MQIISLSLTDCCQLDLAINLGMVITVVLLAVGIRFAASKFGGFLSSKYVIDSVKFGLEIPSVTIRIDNRERDLAYALWVELGTRKAALPFDAEYDVISEVYDSWYSFFNAARVIMRDMPPMLLKVDNSLVYVTSEILNTGLRPHLTRWQAAFRRWFEQALKLDENKSKTPQEIQRNFPQYDELIADLKRTNEVLCGYRDELARIIQNH